MLPFLPIMLISIFLAVAGWGGLAALIILTLPTLGPRWLFFFLFTLALSGTALPVMHFLHRRFPSTPPVEMDVVIREALMVAVFGDLAAWLQLGRVLNPALAIVLAAGLVAIELLLRLRESSRFKPAAKETPDA